MVDELDVYHGSDADFNEFDVSFIKSSVYGWGLYFTTDIELAMDYGKKIYTVEIPDDTEILDLDDVSQVTKQRFFNLIVDDVKSLPMDGFLTDEDVRETLLQVRGYVNSQHPLYQMLWSAEGVYRMFFNNDINKAKMAVSSLIKRQGYVGSKHATILCIFDPKAVNIKKKDDIGFTGESTFSFKNIIKEMLSPRVYHFTDFDHFMSMVRTDCIMLSSVDKENANDMFDTRNTVDTPTKYFLSTTRVKNSKLGYSIGKMVRIEMNSDVLNANFKAKPVSYFKGNGNESAKQRAAYNMVEYGDEKNSSIMFPSLSTVESEDRMFSNKPMLSNIERYITRVDILYRNWKKLKENPKYLEPFREIFSSPLMTKVFIYDNRNDFDKQGKNVTLDIIKLLDS